MDADPSASANASPGRRTAATVCIVAAVLAVTAPGLASGGTDTPSIRPGTGTNACTLGFLFRSENNSTWYASTAGHCVETGQEIYVWPDGPVIGDVVARRNDGYDDWALIRVPESSEKHLDPSMRYWTGPGQPDGHGVRSPDRVCHYGTGDLYKWTERTRHRCGKIQGFHTQDGITVAEFRSRTWPGDSGSPVIHYASGEAIGILTKGWPGYFSKAIEVCSMQQRFAAHGYNLTLGTAPYDPPPADPTVPGPTVSLEGRPASACL